MPRNNPYSNVPAAPTSIDLAELAEGRDVEIDIGFGRGHFVLDRARARPEALILGLEMRRKWVGLVSERAARRGLTNLQVWYGDARYLLADWGPAASLSAAFINFPDPWWKERHQKRLVVSPSTVRELARLLRPGGQLLVQTDVEDRVGFYRAALESEPSLREALGDAASPLDHNPIGTQSHREKKCAQAGLPVYRLFFEKISSPETLRVSGSGHAL
jgi:tRNA (guanine-N7-)-methyltransferase